MKFRLLNADEIEARVSIVKSSGVSLLLYKDARCDMNILDETVGAMNWMRTHSRDNANCTVSLWDDDKKMWISKEDTGTESYTEKEKGLASDSFKRACFNWGIGRELYTAPFIWIPASNCNILTKGTGYTCNDRFSVTEIGYDDKRRINHLVIVNNRTKDIVFAMVADEPKLQASNEKIDVVKARSLAKRCKDDGVNVENLCKLYKVKKLEDLTMKKFMNIHENWDKIKVK